MSTDNKYTGEYYGKNFSSRITYHAKDEVKKWVKIIWMSGELEVVGDKPDIQFIVMNIALTTGGLEQIKQEMHSDEPLEKLFKKVDDYLETLLPIKYS